MKRMCMDVCRQSWRVGGVVVALWIAAAPAWASPQTDFRLEREIRWRLVPVFTGQTAPPVNKVISTVPKARVAPE